MKASAAKSGKSVRIVTKLAPPFSLPNFPSRAGTNRSEILPSPTVSSTVWSTTPIASRCAASPCEKTATHPGIKVRMIPHLHILRKQGQRGCCPFPLHPKSPPTRPPLRCRRSRLTIPNTYSTITMPASLRSDCCSPSLRNAVRLPSGIDVRLHRNTHRFSLVFTIDQPSSVRSMQPCRNQPRAINANSERRRNDTARARWLKVGRGRRLVTELAFRRLYASLDVPWVLRTEL